MKQHRFVIPCHTTRLQKQLAAAGKALARLTAQGFVVERVELSSSTRATITVLPDTRCRRKQENGQAVRYAQGVDAGGRFERWQFQDADCRVSWEVR